MQHTHTHTKPFYGEPLKKNVNKEIPVEKLQLLHIFISLPGKAAGLNNPASYQA